MKWIGLTGGIATGKSSASKILRDLGLPVVDADSLAREVTRPHTIGLKMIVNEFGEQILDENGELNRRKLGQIVFVDKHKLEKLENILHPLIQEARARERLALEQKGCEIAFYDVPLLFEKNLQDEFDAVLLIYAKPEEQRRRMRERDKLSETEITNRLSAQIPIDDKLKLADYVIINNSTLVDLKNNLLTVLNEITKT